MEIFKSADQVVLNETDVAKISKIQDYDELEDFVEELKNGPGKICQVVEQFCYVAGLSGKVYEVKRTLLTKYKRITNFKFGDKVKIIRSEENFNRYMGVWGDIPKDITDILGKIVEIVQIFVDGDYGVKYNNTIFVIKEKCIAKKESTQEYSTNESISGFQNMKIAALYNTIQNDNLVLFSVLIDEIDPNAKFMGSYPLIFACAFGLETFVKILLDHGADVNAKDDRGSTALHIAVHKKLLKLCELLLKYGADVNSLDNDKDTPIMLAINLGYMDIVKLLSGNKKANLLIGDLMDNTALHLALQQNNIECIEFLLNIGGCPKSARKSQDFPFHWAVIKEDTKILEIFLKMFGDSIINEQHSDKTAVHNAVYHNKTKSLKMLIDHKADINLQNSKLQTPLHIAVMLQNMDCVKMLVENKAELELKDNNGYTPFHFAVFLKNVDLMKFTKIKQERQRFKTSSFYLTDKLDDIAIYLAKAGAQIDMIKEDVQTALDSYMDESLKKKLFAIRDERNSKKAAEIPSILVQSDSVRKSVAEEIKKLRQTIKQMRNERMCKMCSSRHRSTVFGCGHTACDICANDLTDCWLCHLGISVKIKIID